VKGPYGNADVVGGRKVRDVQGALEEAKLRRKQPGYDGEMVVMTEESLITINGIL
jgi:hypothetical protein